MANFRNFTLYNADKTDSIGLNDFDGYLVTAPTGLGVYLDNSYFMIGNKRILTKQKYAFHNLTMVIDIFAKTRNEVEQKYINIRNFISRYRATGFKLAYLPYSQAQERYIDCDIKILDKTEKMTRSMMTIPVTIEPRTMWQVDAQSARSAQSHAVDMWSFDLDSGIAGKTTYTAETENQTGENAIIVYGYGYNVLPDGIRLNASIMENSSSTVFNTTVTLDDFDTYTETVYKCKKVLQTSDENFSRTVFDVTLDIGQRSMVANAIKEQEISETATLQYTEEYKQGNGFAVIEFVFTDDYSINSKKSLSLEYTINGAMETQSYTFDAGQKYAHVVVYGLTSSVNYTGVVGENILYYTEIVGSDQDYTWSVSGIVSIGYPNYNRGFNYDINVGEYNIAMFGGSTMLNSIVNDGDTEIPLKIRIEGSATNPTIKILPKGQGSPIQTTKINYTIPASAYVEIDSDPENTGAWIHYASGITNNIISSLDQTTNMFLTLPKGEYSIQVVDENSNEVVTTVFYKIEYLGA